MAFIRKEKDLLVIDIRRSSQFNSTDTSLSENIGRIKGAISAPYDEFKDHLGEWAAYKQKNILIYGESGDGNSSRAALTLAENGFTKVFHLLGGVDNFIAGADDRIIIENPSPYYLLNAERSLKLLQNEKDLVIYDARPDVEYNNQLKGMVAYRNLGRIKNAVHITDVQSLSSPPPADKNASILVYGNTKEAFQVAKQLTGMGYKKVFLMSSFYDFVWSGFNVEKCREAKAFLENHQGLY